MKNKYLELYNEIKTSSNDFVKETIDFNFKIYGVEFLESLIANAILDIEAAPNNPKPNRTIAYIEKYSELLIQNEDRKKNFAKIINSLQVWIITIGTFGLFILELTKFIVSLFIHPSIPIKSTVEKSELKITNPQKLLRQNLSMSEVEVIFGRPDNIFIKRGKIEKEFEEPTIIIWYYSTYPIKTSDKGFGKPSYINFVPDRFLLSKDTLLKADSLAWEYGEQSDSYKVASFVGSFPYDTLDKNWVGSHYGAIPLKTIKRKWNWVK